MIYSLTTTQDNIFYLNSIKHKKATKLGGPSQTVIFCFFGKIVLMFYNNLVVFHIFEYSLTSVFQIKISQHYRANWQKDFQLCDVITIYYMIDKTFYFEIMWLFFTFWTKFLHYFHFNCTKLAPNIVKNVWKNANFVTSLWRQAACFTKSHQA